MGFLERPGEYTLLGLSQDTALKEAYHYIYRGFKMASSQDLKEGNIYCQALLKSHNFTKGQDK